MPFGALSRWWRGRSGAKRRRGRQQAARLVAKILSGAKPAELRLEQPLKFEVVTHRFDGCPYLARNCIARWL
jgi:hypothetical protein